jgi:hypothetical protein
MTKTYLVHAQVVADAVLPALGVVLAFVRVVAEPLVDLLQRHGAPRRAQEGAVDEFGVGFFALGLGLQDNNGAGGALLVAIASVACVFKQGRRLAAHIVARGLVHGQGEGCAAGRQRVAALGRRNVPVRWRRAVAGWVRLGLAPATLVSVLGSVAALRRDKGQAVNGERRWCAAVVVAREVASELRVQLVVPVELLCCCLPGRRAKLRRRLPAAGRGLSRAGLHNVAGGRGAVERVVLKLVAACLRSEAAAPVTWVGVFTVAVVAPERAHARNQLLLQVGGIGRGTYPGDLLRGRGVEGPHGGERCHVLRRRRFGMDSGRQLGAHRVKDGFRVRWSGDKDSRVDNGRDVREEDKVSLMCQKSRCSLGRPERSSRS